MRVSLIAAVAANGVIGKDGEMPWQYPEDLAHFRRRTLGRPVIVGRITHEAIVDRLGGPLPERASVVLTRSPERVDTAAPSVQVATTISEALELARQESEEVAFVAGGASVYEQFLPIADRLVLTEIHEEYDGDTVFPAWDRSEWRAVERDDRDALSFVTYDRESD